MNILCILNFHKYEQIKAFWQRCDNCENIYFLCFPSGIKMLKCKVCGKIKLKDNACEVCGHRVKL